MASVSDFSSEGITVLDASADNDAFIQVDYFGQGVLVRVDLESRTLLGGHAYRTLRRTLGNAAHAFSHATRVSSPSDQDVAAAAAAAARRTIRRALAPLLHDCVAPGLAPDRDDRGRLNLAWCIYDGVQAFELAQDVEGNVYLAEAVVLMEEPPPPPSEGGSQSRHGFAMARGRPVFMADRLALRVTSVSLRSITGTVTLATASPQRRVRHTCLALRDVSAAGLRAASGAAASMAPTLDALHRATTLRERLSLEEDDDDDLCVPALVGYIAHTVTRADGRWYTYAVGGVVELMEDARSWWLLRRPPRQRDRPPRRERQQRWARRVRATMETLHGNGIAWGGAAGVPEGERGRVLMESVDVDADGRPWLVRNFAVVGEEEGAASDRAAVEEMLAMVGMGSSR